MSTQFRQVGVIFTYVLRGGLSYGHFLPYARVQRSLLPPAQQELVPEGDPAWFIFDAVAQWGAQRMNLWYSMGSNNRLGDAFTQYHPN